jgi:hypothetical protein
MDESKALTTIDPSRMDDISEAGMKKIQLYIDQGLPGIMTVDTDTLSRLGELYLSGKTYAQISNIVRVDITTIMYLSYKHNWSQIRKDYMVELEDQMKRRVIEAKLVSQDFLLQLSQLWEKKIGNKITRYLATNNEEFADQINLKEIDRYLKTMELLQKSLAEPKSDSRGPLVGLNIGDGATITRKGDNELEITPKQRAIGDILKQHADMMREEEKNK